MNQPTRLYAVGDIHGSLGQLEALQQHIQADAAAYTGKCTLVYVGDYIDRGLHSKEVIENLCTPLAGMDEVHTLIGNHDLHLQRFSQGKPPSTRMANVAEDWIFLYGGLATLASYGVQAHKSMSIYDIQEHVTAAVPAHHKEFLNQLHPFVQIGEFVCVHGGINPNLQLAKHTVEDLVYPRPDAFQNHGWEEIIVFGHTIHDKPLVEHDRIGVDTGAYTGGKLTCAVLTVGEGTKTVRFLQA